MRTRPSKNGTGGASLMERHRHLKHLQEIRTGLLRCLGKWPRTFASLGSQRGGRSWKSERSWAKHKLSLPLPTQRNASAAVQALTAVHGPDITSGKEDEIVEPSVRRNRVATLRATLTVHPDFVSATCFNGSWARIEKGIRRPSAADR